MTKQRARIWVSPPFKKMLKSEASLKGMDLISYTEELAKKKKGNLKEVKINNHWSKLI